MHDVHEGELEVAIGGCIYVYMAQLRAVWFKQV